MKKISQELEKISRVMPLADTVSPTFCLAKWHHVTIYLQSGETHSCYHPAPHKIPLDELAADPSALHNTRQKKRERKQMLDGERPSGCQYCWNVEDLPGDHVSDRHIRTASIYTPERFENCASGPWDQNINPEYIEISFGNECNFKCAYCHPKASSRYFNEIKQHGPYTETTNHRCDIDYLTMYEEENNPYVKAWWDWWPEVSKTLNILRVTGGEPLMHASTWRLLDSLEQNPMPWLELNVNSNLGVKPALVDKLCGRINDVKGKVRAFKLFTSIDTWGARAEYIRHGLDVALFERNLRHVLDATDAPITFMITFNLFCVTSFQELLEKILEWRSIYNRDRQRIRFDTPYLREPLQHDMLILPKDDYIGFMHSHLAFMRKHCDDTTPTKFSELEVKKFERVVDYMAATNHPESVLTQARADFFGFFSQHDERRGTSFEATFPEMTGFFSLCQEEWFKR